MNEIDPCPFCKSHHAPQVRELPAKPRHRYVVVCHNCAARGPAHETHRGAIGAWNNRPADVVSIINRIADEGDTLAGLKAAMEGEAEKHAG